MGDLLKITKAWAVTSIAYRWAIALGIIGAVSAIALGEGGTFSISWTPGG